MNISQRLRTCARHTGLDAVIELLNEAADEIDALHARANWQATQAEVTGLLDAFDEAVAQELPRVSHVEYDSHEICKHFASRVRAILALHPVQVPMTPLTDAQMEKGRDQIFSINNPYCPCDRKTFKKVAQWVERHHQIGITAQIKKEVP